MIWQKTFHVKPIAKGRPRRGKLTSYTPERTRDAEDDLKIRLRCSRPYKFTGAISVSLLFIFKKPKSAPKSRVLPSVKPDIDNLAKLVLDCANGICYDDDNQICDLLVQKRYGPVELTDITIRDME